MCCVGVKVSGVNIEATMDRSRLARGVMPTTRTRRAGHRPKQPIEARDRGCELGWARARPAASSRDDASLAIVGSRKRLTNLVKSQTLILCLTASSSSTVGLTGAHEFSHCGAAALSGGHPRSELAVSLPKSSVGGHPSEQRDKSYCIFPSAAACRPVAKEEMRECPTTNKAIHQEWIRLRARTSWGEDNLRV